MPVPGDWAARLADVDGEELRAGQGDGDEGVGGDDDRVGPGEATEGRDVERLGPGGVLAHGRLNAPAWVYADIDRQALDRLRQDPEVFIRRDWHQRADLMLDVACERR